MAGQLILNRYRVLETTGKGGFATVDVALDTRLQRRVALKRIPLTVDETDLPGIQEARTAVMLKDPRIVDIIDFEVTGTEALIIMEYIDGPTLGDLLRESPDLLDLDTIATIFGDVAAALDYAHENQVLHLDIKADNILIDHSGYTKVSDFGLAQLSSTAGFAEPQGGTLGSMPPEQLIQGDVDGRTDLWALATLLYQLLTGMSPFAAPTAAESLSRIQNEPLALPSELREGLDPAIDAPIVRALMANKADRYTRISEFVRELTPHLGNAKTGRKRLKYRVNQRDLDELEFTDEWHEENPEEPDDTDDVRDSVRGPIWDRLPARLRGVLARLAAALACGSFAFTGLTGFEPLVPPDQHLLVIIGVVALIAFGSFIVPQLGSALACLVFVAGVIVRGLIVVGIVLAVLLIVWWLFCGRHGRAESTVVMLSPLWGALWLSFALPLLAGFFLPWRRAALAAAIQWLILITMASMTGAASIAHTALMLPEQLQPFPRFLFLQEGPLSASMLANASNPFTWFALIAFVLAALLLSLLAGHGAQRDETRGTTNAAKRWAAFGIVLAFAVIVLACVAAPLLIDTAPLGTASATASATATATAHLPQVYIVQTGVDLALSFILLLILLLLGVPAGVPASARAGASGGIRASATQTKEN